jgi:hypothetical protein
MILRSLLLSLICVSPLLAKSNDFTLIRQLPQRIVTMNKEGHKKWDKGITGTMLEGSEDFNQGLVRILKELIRSHATKTFIKESEVDAYVQVLVSKLKFEAKLGNPRGEDRGTLASLEIPSGLSVELQDAIVILVKGIVEDDESFDFDDWRKEWEQALHASD